MRLFLILAVFLGAFLKGETSLRNRLGENAPLEHTKSELRFGYKSVSEGDATKRAFAVGGHLHFYTKRFMNVSGVLSIYSVADFGLNPDFESRDQDLLGASKRGGSMVSEAFLRYSEGKSVLMVGRMMVDTPHMDSDDIMMVPNFFEGLCFKKELGEDYRLTLAKFDKMAGWENGAEAFSFVDISKVAGLEGKSGGVAFAAMEKLVGETLFEVWFYRFFDIADDLYVKFSKTFFTETFVLDAAFQFDRAWSGKDSYLYDIQSATAGVLLELFVKDVKIMAAYNEEFGSSASMFSLGGGPFFTSMEYETIDAVSAPAVAYNLGVEFEMGDYASLGYLIGEFKAKDDNDYHSIEQDIYIQSDIGDSFSLQAVFSSVDFRHDQNSISSFRLILKRSFRR